MEDSAADDDVIELGRGAVLVHGDCRDVLRALPDASMDAVVTDPPYELGFMGRTWDASGIAYNVDLWRECLRVLKPGGHLLAFGGTRTYHRMACAVEDAGFEIRDSITWLYGSGFPKSLDVSKAIDKAAGAERRVIGEKTRPDGRTFLEASPNGGGSSDGWDRPWRYEQVSVDLNTAVTAPATADAARWQGWGTALKPASEPIVVARKPLAGTVAATVLAHGTGAINVDACRVGDGSGVVTFDRHAGDRSREEYRTGTVANAQPSGQGRWPSNVVLSHASTADGGDACADGCVEGCPVAELDAQSGNRVSGWRDTDTAPRVGSVYGNDTRDRTGPHYADSGGASRFFPTFRYQAKAPAKERPKVDGVAHNTVKPLALMRWLVRLVTPPGGMVLEPFAGSGTTVEACLLEGRGCFAVEYHAPYLPLIRVRAARAIAQLTADELDEMEAPA